MSPTREILEETVKASKVAVAASRDPSTRPKPPVGVKSKVDMKTAIQALRLQIARDEANNFYKPWYVIDPTGDIAKKQFLAERERRRREKTMSELRAADADGDGAFSISELKQYSQQRHAKVQKGKSESLAALARLARRALVAAAERFDPRGFTIFPAWDFVSAIALVFTAVVTPYEVGFLPASTSPSEGLFIINRIVDSVFVIDLVLQFFLMYHQQVITEGAALLVWEIRLDRIAHKYVTSWFFVIDGKCAGTPAHARTHIGPYTPSSRILLPHGDDRAPLPCVPSSRSWLHRALGV